VASPVDEYHLDRPQDDIDSVDDYSIEDRASSRRPVGVREASLGPIDVENAGTGGDASDLLIAIVTIESRILRLVRHGACDIPVDNLAGELSLLSRDLGRCYRRLSDLRDRRDLTFKTQRKLERLQEQCIWLYRKAHREVAFFKKLDLETRLRSLISGDAFDVYQQLLCAEDDERRLAARDDTALAALLAEPEFP